jgi:hypothetical protein
VYTKVNLLAKECGMEFPVPFPIYQYYDKFLAAIGPDMLIVVGGVLTVLGAALCLMGFRYFRVMMALLTGVTGGIAALGLTEGLDSLMQLGAALGGALVAAFLGWLLYWPEIFLAGAGLCMLVTMLARTSMIVGLGISLAGGVLCLIFKRFTMIICTSLIGAALIAWAGTIFFISLESPDKAYSFAAMSINRLTLIPDTAMFIGICAMLFGMLIQWAMTRPKYTSYTRTDRLGRASRKRKSILGRKASDGYDGYEPYDDTDEDADHFVELEVPEEMRARPEHRTPRRPPPDREAKGQKPDGEDPGQKATYDLDKLNKPDRTII